MPSIERTAYPCFSPITTASELQQSFTPTDAEREFAQASTRSHHHAFCFLVLLKCFQRLHYFPPLEEIPSVIVDHLPSCLQLPPSVPLAYENERTLYRHCATIREHLRINTFYGKQARHIAVQAVYKAAQVMNPAADLINAAIEASGEWSARRRQVGTRELLSERRTSCASTDRNFPEGDVLARHGQIPKRRQHGPAEERYVQVTNREGHEDGKAYDIQEKCRTQR